jgi:ribonuclease D
MKYFLTSRELPIITSKDTCIGSFEEFKLWADNQTDFQLDTETNIPPDGPNQDEDRILTCLQLGDIEEDIQWVIDWIGLDQKIKDYCKYLLNSKITVYIHNAMFDYKVIYNGVGAELKDVHDTFLMSKILNTGYTHYPGYHSLAHCLNRFFELTVDKTEQKGFGTSEIFTQSQIEYAGKDVMFLYALYEKLKELLESWELWYLYNEIERKVLLVYAKMELTKMRFDVEHWTNLAKGFIEERDGILEELNKSLFDDPTLLAKLKDPNNGVKACLIQPYDKTLISWGSTIHKNKITL